MFCTSQSSVGYESSPLDYNSNYSDSLHHSILHLYPSRLLTNMKAIYSLLILISYTLSTESFRSVVYSFGFSSYTSQIGSLNIRERYSQQSRVDLINDNQKYKRSDPSMFSGGSLYSAIEPIAKQVSDIRRKMKLNELKRLFLVCSKIFLFPNSRHRR